MRSYVIAAAFLATASAANAASPDENACNTPENPMFAYNQADTIHDYTPVETEGSAITPIISRQIYRGTDMFEITTEGGFKDYSRVFNKVDCHLVTIERDVYEKAIAASDEKKTLNISLYPTDKNTDALCMAVPTSHASVFAAAGNPNYIVVQFKLPEGERMKKERGDILAADTEEKIRCYKIKPVMWSYMKLDR